MDIVRRIDLLPEQNFIAPRFRRRIAGKERKIVGHEVERRVPVAAGMQIAAEIRELQTLGVIAVAVEQNGIVLFDRRDAAGIIGHRLCREKRHKRQSDGKTGREGEKRPIGAFDLSTDLFQDPLIPRIGNPRAGSLGNGRLCHPPDDHEYC